MPLTIIRLVQVGVFSLSLKPQCIKGLRARKGKTVTTPAATKVKAPRRVGLARQTRARMYRRKLWRTRALQEMIKLAEWPVGKPAREVSEAAVSQAVNKVRRWFPGVRGMGVLAALNRRAVAHYRAMTPEHPIERPGSNFDRNSQTRSKLHIAKY